MSKNKATAFVLMHFGFLVYSFYTIAGKYASKYEFLSLNFCISYAVLIVILFLYALIWQQALKVFPLSFAMANKASTIVWGMLWSFLFFNEEITIRKIVGAIIIVSGILFLSLIKNSENNNG